MPGREFTFGDFIAAQAAGDAQVLAEHGRPVLRLHLTDHAQGLAQVRAALDEVVDEPGSGLRLVEPAAGPPRQAAPPHRRAVLDGALRGHRRPRAQEAHAGDLRPGQPRAAAAGVLAHRVRAPRLGRPGLRQDRLRVGARAGPYPVPRGGVALPRRGNPVRAGHVRRRRRLRPPGPDRPAARRAPRHRGQPRLLPVDPAVVLRHGRASSSSGRPVDAPPGLAGAGSSSRSRSATTSTSARELNTIVEKVFPADSVFRIDHYLGKETVQNLLALRFANQMFEPVWNANYVDHVQITMAEDIGIGGRAGYYDGIGAARDVIQNHLLQLLALTAMEEPVSFDAQGLRLEKEKVLSAVRIPARPRQGHGPRAVRQGLAGRARRSSATSRSRGSPRTRAPRRTPRCGSTSTPGAGRACRSTCAPASASASGSPRSPSSSSGRRTCRSPTPRPRSSGRTPSSSACSPTRA